MNSPHLPPLGNRPLPKISYSKLSCKPLSGASKQNLNDVRNVAGNGESDTEHLKAAREATFVMPAVGEEHQTGSPFARFSVLPPIPGSEPGSRRGNPPRLVLPASCKNDDSSSRASGKYVGNVLVGDKRRGSGFVASSPRRDSCLKPAAQFTCRNGDLEIVGNSVADKVQYRNDRDRPSLSIAAVPSPALGEPDASEHFLRENTVRLKGKMRKKLSGDEPELSRKVRKSSKTRKVQRHHSDMTNKSSFLSTNEAMDVSTISNQLSLSLPQSESRPLSRGQVSFVGFEELLTVNRQASVQEGRRKSFGRLSISMPVIQIDGVTEVNNNHEVNSNNSENIEVTSTEPTPSSAQANWQLLIDSLEHAKEERPKQCIGVPYTSLREKRRRSALCRNNSKQVDDFLLVHNLRDLGLL